MSRLAMPVVTEAPPVTVRDPLPPVGGPAYVIEGRPGWHYTSIEEACLVAADLMERLRLSSSVKVRERGSETIVAMTARREDGTVFVVRMTGGAA